MNDPASGPTALHRRWWARRSRIPTGALVAIAVLTALTSAERSTDGAAAGPVDGPAPQLRTYYLAADPVRWDYAPDGINGVTGEPWDEAAATFTEAGPDRIGSTYLKSLYREYTDGSFTTLKPRPATWEHLGDLGPVIHAAVGDEVRIVFKNDLPRPASIHMHGLKYDKASEGAPYEDGTDATQKADDAVPPGQVHTYDYTVPDRAGPGPMDPSSVMWMYHSHTDEVGDTYSGLMGPVVVTRRDAARADGTPRDVDRELIGIFEVSDENQSLDMPANMASLSAPPAPDDEEFVESNLMHSINGYLYGNMPLGTAPGEGMTVEQG
jgi:FtsP/CotA-like multicopper oxidase with cupredoxin domain